MESEVLLPYTQEPATGPYSEPDQSSPHPLTLRSILILSYHLSLDRPNDFFPSCFRTKFYTHLSSPSHVLHAPLSHPPWFNRPNSNLLKSGPTKYEAPHYAIYANLMPLPLS
jgi:hypothetical protein